MEIAMGDVIIHSLSVRALSPVLVESRAILAAEYFSSSSSP